MNGDNYVNSVLARHPPTYGLSDAIRVRNALQPTLAQWSNGYLHGLYVAGSLAKGTGISGTTDIDILVSLRHDTPNTLQEIHTALFNWLTGAGYSTIRQNVSVGLSTGQNNALKIDVVPARKVNAWTNDHWLWSHKRLTRTQTNTHEHVRLIANSGRQNEIRAVKVWRKCNGLEFPSFLLEMSVIRALAGYRFNNLAYNFVTVLEYIRDELPRARIIDPSNSNNNVTDDMSQQEKQILSRTAATSLARDWPQVIW